MDTVGNVLELLHGARDRSPVFQATLRTWHNTLRTHEALGRWAARRSRGSVAMLTYSGRSEPVQPRDEITEQVSRLWVRQPSHLRHEIDLPSGKGVSVKVINGDLWLAYSPWSGVTTNEDSKRPGQMQDNVDENLPTAFDPAPLIPAISSVEVLERTIHAGREAIRVLALARETRYPHAPWHGADHYELLVDAERGILLRSNALMDGQAFAGDEIVSVTFDEPAPDDTFTFVPPPGTKRRSTDPPGEKLWWRLLWRLRGKRLRP